MNEQKSHRSNCCQWDNSVFKPHLETWTCHHEHGNLPISLKDFLIRLTVTLMNVVFWMMYNELKFTTGRSQKSVIQYFPSDQYELQTHCERTTQALPGWPQRSACTGPEEPTVTPFSCAAADLDESLFSS